MHQQIMSWDLLGQQKHFTNLVIPRVPRGTCMVCNACRLIFRDYNDERPPSAQHNNHDNNKHQNYKTPQWNAGVWGRQHPLENSTQLINSKTKTLMNVVNLMPKIEDIGTHQNNAQHTIQTERHYQIEQIEKFELFFSNNSCEEAIRFYMLIS